MRYCMINCVTVCVCFIFQILPMWWRLVIHIIANLISAQTIVIAWKNLCYLFASFWFVRYFFVNFNYCINIVSIYLNILILYNLNVYKIFKQTKFKFKFIIHSQLITPTEQINNLKEYFSESGYVQNLN
jgi:hypothetical protein